ncbi:VC2046/SO_2500 family protein [Neptunicella sp.]|uniref:VC2046/SO_2500 family protein n=1 Tax=Neptunicella sp. TaxID=2125986 RepID=UPI003F68BDCB
MNQTITTISDLEFNGQLTSALNQQGQQQFSLLLAMLEQNYLDRLHIHDEQDKSAQQTLSSDIQGLQCYPVTPLKAEDAHWQQLTKINQMLHSQPIEDVRLYQNMYPEPLSQYNDSLRISDEVLQNCTFSAQRKMQQPDNTDKQVEVDETELFDLLNQIHHNEQAA